MGAELVAHSNASTSPLNADEREVIRVLSEIAGRVARESSPSKRPQAAPQQQERRSRSGTAA